MYEELVKRLRKTQKLAEYAAEDVAKMPNMIFSEAADAIETMREMVATAHDELANVIQSYEESKPRWIPVTELLPENDDFVIVTVKDESGDSPYVYSDFGWYFDRAECWIVETEQRTDITHWMPLPEPPKEET